jgi:hypothetical protein
MRVRTLGALLGLAVAGCTTTSSEGQPEPDIVVVTATPLYLGLKLPFCVSTTVIGSGVAALAQLARPWPPVPGFYAGSDSAQETRRDMNDDIVANCGPPYYVTP